MPGSLFHVVCRLIIFKESLFGFELIDAIIMLLADAYVFVDV